MQNKQIETIFFKKLIFVDKKIKMNSDETLKLLRNLTGKKEIDIAEKVLSGQRLTISEGLFLFQEAELNYLSLLSTARKMQISENKVYFNRNFHIEPTNICVYNCKFCSYKRRFGDAEAWEYSIDDILSIVKKYKGQNVTEVHITGGVHPHYSVEHFCVLLRKIRSILPNIHIKAFTAVEVEFMARKSRMDVKQALLKLKECGLNSMPGGGAEIFDEEVRAKICDDKSKTKSWLEIHRTAHQIGLKTNATILYGHIENYNHRLDHLDRIRKLQDETNGFNAFIPLKYLSYNNALSYAGMVPITEDMRNYAVTRLFLDNIPHLKAYWVMLGRQHAQMALNYGVDDLDGTIDDSTKIYTMAGSEEKKPGMTATEMVELIKKANFLPVERDSLYNELQIFDNE